MFKSATQNDAENVKTAIQELSNVAPAFYNLKFDNVGAIHANQTVYPGATAQQNNIQGGGNTLVSSKYNITGQGEAVNIGKGP